MASGNPRQRSGASRIFALIISFALIGGLIYADRVLKDLAVLHKGEADRTVIENILSLTYTENTGIAFSLLSGATKFITILTVLLLGLLLVTMLTGFVRGPLGSAGMIMIIAGGVGNVIDRLRLGYVVDYIRFDFINFPVFNFADILVTVGVVLFAIWLIVTSLKDDEKTRERKIDRAVTKAHQKRELLSEHQRVPVPESAPVNDPANSEIKAGGSRRPDDQDNA